MQAVVPTSFLRRIPAVLRFLHSECAGQSGSEPLYYTFAAEAGQLGVTLTKENSVLFSLFEHQCFFYTVETPVWVSGLATVRARDLHDVVASIEKEFVTLKAQDRFRIDRTSIRLFPPDDTYLGWAGCGWIPKLFSVGRDPSDPSLQMEAGKLLLLFPKHDATATGRIIIQEQNVWSQKTASPVSPVVDEIEASLATPPVRATAFAGSKDLITWDVYRQMVQPVQDHVAPTSEVTIRLSGRNYQAIFPHELRHNSAFRWIATSGSADAVTRYRRDPGRKQLQCVTPSPARTIVHVEPNEEIRELIRHYPYPQTWQLIQLTNGAEAMEYVARGNLDLLITNGIRSGEDIGAFIKTARELQPSLPIMVWSGFASDPLVTELRHRRWMAPQLYTNGASLVVPKKILPTELIAAIRSVFW